MPQLDVGALIAIIFIVLIGLLLLISLFRFKTVEDVLKLWGGLGSIATAIATFYFTTGAAEKRIDKAEREKQAATQSLEKAEQRIAELSNTNRFTLPLNTPNPLMKPKDILTYQKRPDDPGKAVPQ